MSWRRRIQAALGGALAGTGVMLGAMSQQEVFLDPGADLDTGAAGNIIPLTALLTALGLTWIAMARRGDETRRRRLLQIAPVIVCLYAVQVVVQSSFPYVAAILESRVAILSIAPILADLEANPGVLMAPMVLLALLVWGAQRLGGRAGARSAPAPASSFGPVQGGEPGFESEAHVREIRDLDGVVLLLAPFLVVVIAAQLRLLALWETPPSGLMIFTAVLGMAGAGALVITGPIRSWHVRTWVRRDSLAPAARESHRLVLTVERVAAGALVAAGLLATALPKQAANDLEVGLVFGMTLRGFGQSTLFVVLLLIPYLMQGLRWQGTMDVTNTSDGSRPGAGQRHGRGPYLPGWWMLPVAGAATLAAALPATFLATGALVPWAVALAPAAAAAVARGRQSLAAPTMLLLLTLWCIGNTLTASFSDRDFAGLVHGRSVAALVAVRLVAASTGAWFLFRFLDRLSQAGAGDGASLPRSMARQRRRRTAVLAASTSLALAVFMEASFSIWVHAGSSVGVNQVGVGSLVSSLPQAFAGTVHTLTVVAAAWCGALAVWHLPVRPRLQRQPVRMLLANLVGRAKREVLPPGFEPESLA